METVELATIGDNNTDNAGATTAYGKPVSDPSLLPRKRSGILGSCSNLVNSIVGAGIIGIPFALRESGLLSGILLLVAVGLFTDKSLRMLADLALRSPPLVGRGVWAYDDLMGLPYGRPGRWFVQASMLVTAYGAMVAYLLIIKDTVPVLLGLVDDGDDASAGGFLERELVMLATSAGVALPLSMQRDFSSLSCTSGLSVTADVAMVGVVVSILSSAPYIPANLEEAGGFGAVLAGSWIRGGFFIGFGVLTVAMCCQHSAFIALAALDRPTPNRWAAVSGVSLAVSVACCLVLGIAGYLGFLEETRGDVLNNLPVGSGSANTARLLLAITMFFTYPMESFVARHVLVQLLWDGDLDGYIPTEETPAAEPDGVVAAVKPPKRKACFCLTRRHQATLAIYIATLVPALVVDDLGPVLSITGSIGGCCLAYIGPGLAYLGVFGKEFLERLARLLESRNSPATTTTATTAAAELPVAGDAGARMDDGVAAASGTGTAFDPRVLFLGNGGGNGGTHPRTTKPWWWYPLGMPLWIRIAAAGWTGMEDSLAAHDADAGTFQMRPRMSVDEGDEPEPRDGGGAGAGGAAGAAATAATTPPEPQHETNETTVVVVAETVWDFGVAIFFVVFGAVALVAGLASNIYVQVHGIVDAVPR